MLFMLFIVVYVAVMFGSTALYIKHFYDYYGFVGTSYGEYNIRDRNGLLLVLLKSWGMFFMISLISFHIVWFVATPFWIILLYMQAKYIKLWVHHGYSRIVFIFLNIAVIVLFFVLSPGIRSIILANL